MNPIESIEVIPMNKESIFDEAFIEVPATPEDGGTTKNAELWLEGQSDGSTIELKNGSFNRAIDISTSEWFAKKFPNASYLLGPVGIVNHNGIARTLTAKSCKVTDFNEFLESIANKQIWMYRILFQPNLPKTYYINDKFEPVMLDYPKVADDAGCWVIRYAEIEPIGEIDGN